MTKTKAGTKILPEAKVEIKGTTIQGQQNKGVKIIDKSGKTDGQ